MTITRPILISEQRPRGSGHNGRSNSSTRFLERRDSEVSNRSLIDTIPMACNEVFSGPMGESVPESLKLHAHRSGRADSILSSTVHRDDDDVLMVLSDENAITDHELEIQSDEQNLIDLESGKTSNMRRSPGLSERNFTRNSSRTSIGPGLTVKRPSQTIHIVTEDLTIIILGFKTSFCSSILYKLVCCLSLGLGYLLLRWMPHWKVALFGQPCSLCSCDWVVIKNNWREFTVQKITSKNYGYPLSTVFNGKKKYYDHHLEDDGDPIMSNLRILEYRYMRFVFHPLRDKFVLNNNWKDPLWTDKTSIRAGINVDEINARGLLFGKNSIDVKQKSILQLLIDEVLHPFYVFQIASLVLWSLDEYYYYALCILIISLVSVTTTLIEARSTMQRLRDVSKFECDIRVLRNSFWRYITSSELVPGDVFEVTDPALKQLPCDSVLLAGDCIVNESLLTGESVPISKYPITNEALRCLNLRSTSVAPDVAKHFLFGGTKIIRARRPQQDGTSDAVALAMVVCTGFNTIRGALVRSMLFPKPSGFSFYRDSFRYISVMAVIAMLGFIISFINFVRLKLEWHLIIIRALDLITIVVPPALPATLTIGTNFAISRLKGKQIFCTSPQRVSVGGKLDLVCFDKTGTLTEDGLDVLGVRIVQRAENRFGDLFTTASLNSASDCNTDQTTGYNLNNAALHLMATCHSLRKIDNNLTGDPLDVKMFEFTGWNFEEGELTGEFVDDYEPKSISPPVVRPPFSNVEYGSDGHNQLTMGYTAEIGILKSFEFVSHLRRTSVIVREFGSFGCEIYVKGAPECMKQICKSASFPIDFDDVLTYYTHRGFRVIALATKHITKLSWVKIQKMNRCEAESDLDFIGFLIFENKLKPSTTSVLDELTQAGIRKMMCTGDNILTAISVARECNLISPFNDCFVPHFIQGDSEDPSARLRWESVNNSSLTLDETTLAPSETNSMVSHDILDAQNYSIAMTGDSFRWIVDFAPINILHKVLIYGQVFARMSPDQKNELVEKLQSIDYCCGFCGDGANDCGALKAADVGISLSEAEASVAAPFTSRIFDITCVPEVIREGRAALVTSFSCFKYMSLYSAIQFTSVGILYATASNLGDFQFLYIDLIIILPIAIFMGWTKPHTLLHRKRPTANLVSLKVLVPLFGQIAITILYQLTVYHTARGQTWYIPPHLSTEKSNIKNSENTILFLLSCFEYIFSGIVLIAGPPFQQSWTQNIPFVLTIVITLAFTLYLLLNPSLGISQLMELTKMSLDFKIFILALGLSYLLLAWLTEKLLWARIAKLIGQKEIGRRPQKKKLYKTILENIHFIH